MLFHYSVDTRFWFWASDCHSGRSAPWLTLSIFRQRSLHYSYLV